MPHERPHDEWRKKEVNRYIDELVPEFLPTYNQTGVTFFQGEQRILKLVNMAKCLNVEFNIAVSPVDGLTFYSKEQAKEKKLGTCQWFYQGSLEVALALIELTWCECLLECVGVFPQSN